MSVYNYHCQKWWTRILVCYGCRGWKHLNISSSLLFGSMCEISHDAILNYYSLVTQCLLVSVSESELALKTSFSQSIYLATLGLETKV